MKRFKDILCVVESGDACKPALERTIRLVENNQARLTVVSVIERAPNAIGRGKGSQVQIDLQDTIMKTNKKDLEALVDPYRQQIDIQTRVLTGIPFLEIIREVLQNGRDLVIKTPEAADWLNRLFGSNDMHLLRKCPCPVWLIKPEAPKSYRIILAAVDVSVDDNYPPEEQEKRQSMNLQILQMASSLAVSEFAELHVVHVWNAPGESTMRGAFMKMPEEEVSAYVEKARQQHSDRLNALLQDVGSNKGRDMLEYLKPQTHLVKGLARKEIPALARAIGADLVVMGTVARTGIPGFIMGNTAETILNQIDCSVLAIKPPDFVTPVGIED